jgi:hypothetical protein
MENERSNEDIMKEFEKAKTRGEISMNPKYMEKLLQLKGFDIVIICDDSGSMLEPSDYQPVGGLRQTRFNELENTVKKVGIIANVIDNNGIDLLFLNSGTYKDVKDDATVSRIFNGVQLYGTPLCTAYRKFIKMYYPRTYDTARNTGVIPVRNMTKKLGLRKQTVHAGIDHTRPILLIIATDGEPSDGSPEYLKHLMEVLNPPNLYRSIVACTGSDHVLKFLKSMDTLDRTDVTDDFNSEKAVIDRIQKVYDPSYEFSYDDYIAKILLGSVDPEMDQLNDIETNFKRTGQQKTSGGRKKYRKNYTRKRRN